MELNNIPIIGGYDSIPTNKVMEAMQSLESELKDYYEELVKVYEEKLGDIYILCNMAKSDGNKTVNIKDVENILDEGESEGDEALQ
jgi:histone H3/H4